MGTAGKIRRATGAGLGPVLLAVFALLVQALLPSAAIAALAGARGETLVICTAMGAQTVTVGAPRGPAKPGFAGLPCQDCLAPAIAALPAPASAPLATGVDYAAVAHPAVTTQPALRGARAPPRPPGQGPPFPNA